MIKIAVTCKIEYDRKENEQETCRAFLKAMSILKNAQTCAQQ